MDERLKGAVVCAGQEGQAHNWGEAFGNMAVFTEIGSFVGFLGFRGASCELVVVICGFLGSVSAA